MIHSYLTGLPNIYPSGTPYNTGDGVRMGLEVGADLWHMSNISGPVFFFKAPQMPVSAGSISPTPRATCSWTGTGRASPLKASRAWDPTATARSDATAPGCSSPPRSPSTSSSTKNLRKAGPIGRAHADWDVSHGGHYAWSDDNLGEVKKGWIKKAATVRDLAEMIQVSPDALEASVARFNGFADAGKDADFGRNPASLATLMTPPYYAIALTPTFINTQGGPRRNKDAQVMGADGQPIARLYSAGELGSIYAFLYQAAETSANASPSAVSPGRTPPARSRWSPRRRPLSAPEASGPPGTVAMEDLPLANVYQLLSLGRWSC